MRNRIAVVALLLCLCLGCTSSVKSFPQTYKVELVMPSGKSYSSMTIRANSYPRTRSKRGGQIHLYSGGQYWIAPVGWNWDIEKVNNERRI